MYPSDIVEDLDGRQLVVLSPTSVTHLPLEPKDQHDIVNENLFMINEEYKESVTHYIMTQMAYQM
jgi:hypothetical protein